MNLFKNINPGFYICIFAFILICIVHLYFCFKMIPKWRKITKPFCMLFLGTAFLFLAPHHPLIYVSVYLSMFGDIFLINNKKALYFITGAIIFAVAHTMNAINQILLLSYQISTLIYIAIGILILFVGVLAFFVAKGKKSITAVGASYTCFHLLNIAIAIMLIVDHKTSYIILVLIGYILYVCSDYIVNYVTNTHDIPRRDFYIMITYLLGQCGIYFGIAMTL